MSDPALDPFSAIVTLAERELELAERGELAGLGELSERWGELTSSLPERPPPAARPLLERASLTNDRTHVELLRLREALLCDLRSTARAGRAASGYARHLRRRQRIDRSA